MMGALPGVHDGPGRLLRVGLHVRGVPGEGAWVHRAGGKSAHPGSLGDACAGTGAEREVQGSLPEPPGGVPGQGPRWRARPGSQRLGAEAARR
eukprot:228009-Pyramimonas_sp.AAC.1